MSYMAYGRSLVRNSPRGCAPKTLPDPEVRVVELKRAAASAARARRHAGTGATDASGRRPIGTRAASAAFPVRNAEDLSEQRGWTPRSPRETPECIQRRRSRAARRAEV